MAGRRISTDEKIERAKGEVTKAKPSMMLQSTNSKSSWPESVRCSKRN